MKKIIYVLLVAIVMASCASNKNTVRMTIASDTAECMGVAPMQCMLIKKGVDRDWSFFYGNINGFDYEKGYEYELEVKEEKVETPIPADASSIKYTLVKEISKTQKTSDNLPSTEKKEQIQVGGKVLSVENVTVGRGGASGQFDAKVVKIEVTHSTIPNVKTGDVIHCELIANPKVSPVAGREYVFKAKHLHPAHALGVYLLDTEVMDLI